MCRSVVDGDGRETRLSQYISAYVIVPPSSRCLRAPSWTYCSYDVKLLCAMNLYVCADRIRPSGAEPIVRMPNGGHLYLISTLPRCDAIKTLYILAFSPYTSCNLNGRDRT